MDGCFIGIEAIFLSRVLPCCCIKTYTASSLSSYSSPVISQQQQLQQLQLTSSASSRFLPSCIFNYDNELVSPYLPNYPTIRAVMDNYSSFPRIAIDKKVSLFKAKLSLNVFASSDSKARYHASLCLLYLFKLEYKTAKRHIKTAITLQPKFALYYYYIALVYGSYGKIEKAKKQLLIAIGHLECQTPSKLTVKVLIHSITGKVVLLLFLFELEHFLLTFTTKTTT